MLLMAIAAISRFYLFPLLRTGRVELSRVGMAGVAR
jgi:hypothetical protein